MTETEKKRWISILEKDYHIIPKSKNSQVSDKTLINIVCNHVAAAHCVPLLLLKSKSRRGQLPDIRYKIIFITLKLRPEMNLNIIGGQFSRAILNTHCLALYGRDRVKGRMDVMPVYKSEIEKLTEECLLKLQIAAEKEICIGCGKEMTDMETNHGTPELPICIHCDNEANLKDN